MKIDFRGQYTKPLFFRAVALANQPSKSRQRLLALMLLVAVGGLGVISYRIITTGDLPGHAVYLAAAIFMGGLAAQVFSRPYWVARKLWQNPGVQRPLQGFATPQGVTYQLAEGENFIPWARFNRRQIRPDLITLIRQGDGLLVVFPREFFGDEAAWRRFNRLVEEHVAPLDEKGIRRPLRAK